MACQSQTLCPTSPHLGAGVDGRLGDVNRLGLLVASHDHLLGASQSTTSQTPKHEHQSRRMACMLTLTVSSSSYPSNSVLRGRNRRDGQSTVSYASQRRCGAMPGGGSQKIVKLG
jgi:hypothetical protein